MRRLAAESARQPYLRLRPLVAAVGVAGALLLAGCGGTSQPAPRPSTTGTSGQAASSSTSPHPIAGYFKPNDQKLSSCRGDRVCTEQAFGNIAYEQTPKTALALVRRLYNTDAAVKSDCHRIVHTIGSAALAKYHSVPIAFSKGDSTCWSGYYHGILERAFLKTTSTAGLANVARGLCASPTIRRTTWLAYQCVHGLGHGLMIYTGYNLPFSLSICHRLATAWDQTSCTGGVFMENINSSYGFHSQWLRKNDLVYPCEIVKRRDKLYCYLMVTSRILQANGYDWKGTARICDRVERGWVSTCFQSYGRDASGFTRQSPVRILHLCRIAGTAGRADCIYGAARDLTANDTNGKRASQLCDAAPHDLRARCFSGIGTILAGFSSTPAPTRAACGSLSRVYVQACLRGARLPS